MWLKQLFSYLRYKYLLHTQRELSARKPNRAACEAVVKEIRSEYFKKYAAANGLTIVMNVSYPSIEVYTNKLKDLARSVKEGKPLAPDWSDGSEYQITLDRFFTSADNHYLDIENAVRQFKETALKLCRAMEESDTATHGVYEHNLRMLTKLFINLRAVAKQLVEVSLTNV